MVVVIVVNVPSTTCLHVDVHRGMKTASSAGNCINCINETSNNVQIIETKLYSNLKRLWEAGHRSKCQLNVLTLLDVQMELWKLSTLHVDLTSVYREKKTSL